MTDYERMGLPNESPWDWQRPAPEMADYIPSSRAYKTRFKTLAAYENHKANARRAYKAKAATRANK